MRIPVTWTEHAEGDLLVNDASVGEVDRAHPRLQALMQVVDYALAKPDMYVVVNAHHEKTLKTQGRAAVLEQLWADIADIFAERDYRLIFELLNEPHRDDDSAMPPETLRDMAGKAYAKIRAVDAERLVVIGGNQWFGAARAFTVIASTSFGCRRTLPIGVSPRHGSSNASHCSSAPSSEASSISPAFCSSGRTSRMRISSTCSLEPSSEPKRRSKNSFAC